MQEHYTLPPFDIERFWARVDRSGGPDACWPWTRGCATGGYGLFCIASKDHRTHRISYYLNSGPFPADLYVCHHCDNPTCVNPSHLFLGTNDDNMRDMVAKGRQNRQRGELCGTSKLVTMDVFALLRRYGDGETIKSIASSFGISRSQVIRIVNQERWAHVDIPLDLAERVSCRRKRIHAGSFNGRAKLSPADVQEIRAKSDDGATRSELSRLFGISRSHVLRIVQGERWQEIPGDLEGHR